MSAAQELEAAIPRLSSQELESFRARLENYCEDRMELKDEVKAKREQARQEIREGR